MQVPDVVVGGHLSAIARHHRLSIGMRERRPQFFLCCSDELLRKIKRHSLRPASLASATLVTHDPKLPCCCCWSWPTCTKTRPSREWSTFMVPRKEARAGRFDRVAAVYQQT